MVIAESVKTSARIASIDIVRGLVMVIMALDHVREYFGATPFRPEDVTQTSLALFASRWITHLCAPNFVFLSGISIFLYRQKVGSLKDTSIYLLSRGLWLAVVEVVVVTFLLELSYQLILLQVIWVIGWSMIFFAALIHLPRQVIGIVALIILLGHNAMPQSDTSNIPGVIGGLLLHSPFVIMNSSSVPVVLVAYTIVPWLAVLMAGYYVGAWLTLPAEDAARRLRLTGMIMIIAFVIIRFINVYGDPAPWSLQERGGLYTVLSFINVTKYPPSLQFVLLMVGLGMLGLAWFMPGRGRVAEWLRVFGQVPFFYYILHLALIAAFAWSWTMVAFGRYVNFGFMDRSQWPDAYEPSLFRVLLVWAAVVTILYFPCRWFANYRKGHKTRWLSYL